jgi:FkbM family methyltransferase
VKARDLLRALRFTRGPREYGSTVASFDLPREGEVRVAHWLHPGEESKVITQASIDALRVFLQPGDVAIDIGAHTGDSTLPIALAVGPSGTVFALEPNPYVFKVLAQNASLNSSKAHIVPLMFAAMPQDGEFDFKYTDEGFCNGGFLGSTSSWRHGNFWTLRVQGRHLLRYLESQSPDAFARLRYIKCDTEGFDRQVMETLASAIQARRPYLKSEIYKHLPTAERARYFDDLRAWGYRVFKCEEQQYRGEELGSRDVDRWRHFDIFAIPEELA